MIRSATPDDAAAICAIYNPYIAQTTITFEEQPVSTEEMRTRIADVTSTLPWLAYEKEGTIVGYAYATRWRPRAAYRFAVETTVYLSPECRRRGIGRQLYTELLDRLRTLGMHVAIGGIALPNEASVALHETLGFRKVAHFEHVGFKFGRWIDVGYWERLVGTAEDLAK